MKKIDLGDGTLLDLGMLVDTRALIQCNSGGGKSWTIRRLLEQTHGQVQHLVIDPEGEFATLRERYDYVLAARHGGDTAADPRAARLLAERLLELGVSAVLDIYELKAHERVRFVREFLEALVDAPKKLWHPALVVVDEAHVFCPQAGEAESAGAVIDLATRGRKRGFCAVLATQRLSKLHKDAAAECNNKLIGRTGLDVDVKRAADELGLAKDRWRELRDLRAGEFFAFGPAISREVVKLKIGAVETTHPKAGARLAAPPPPPREKVKALLPKLADLPAEVEERQKTVDDLKRDNAQLRRELGQARKEQPEPKVERVEIPVLRAEAVEDLNEIVGKLAAAVGGMHSAADKAREIYQGIAQGLERAAARHIHTTATGPRIAAADRAEHGGSPAGVRLKETPAPSRPGNGHDDLRPAAQRRVLGALAWLEGVGVSRPEKTRVALFSKLTPDAGHTRATFGALHTGGLIAYPTSGSVELTEAGRAQADPGKVPQSSAELHDQVLADLPKAQREVLRTLIESYPEAIPKAQAAHVVGLTPDAGHTRATFGRLRTLGLIDYPTQGTVVAARVLFLEGE